MLDQPVGLKSNQPWQTQGQPHPSQLRSEPIEPSIDVQQLKNAVAECVGDSLSHVELELQARLHSQHAVVAQLAQRASAMGGKRLRPMLVLLSAQAAATGSSRQSAGPEKDLVHIAVAVELVHAASLIHDDVMDHADSRRHQPTIGSVSGNSAAILLGDYLFTKAYAAAANCRSTFPARRIAAAASELCEGELRQQLSAGNWGVSQKEYYSILLQKTASLCAVSCRLGAWHVGALREQQRALHYFGKYLGLAFQICDDWLDYWGTGQVGKTLGTDLAQRKPTLPLLYFLQHCQEPQRRELMQLLDDRDQLQQDAICDLIRNSDAGERTLQTAQQLMQRAVGSLQCLPESPAKTALEAVAAFSIQRSM